MTKNSKLSSPAQHEFTPKESRSDICAACGGLRITPAHGYDLAASPSRGNEAPHNSVTVRFGFGEFDLSTLKEDEFVTASGLNDGGWVVCKRLPSTPEETGPHAEIGMDEATETRWQSAIYELCKEILPDVDGGGCDSGDALDVTLSEIRQVFGHLEDAAPSSVTPPQNDWQEKYNSLNVERYHELQKYQGILEAERTKVSRGVTEILHILNSRDWLTEGRGPYEWDDDNWHKEFGYACQEIRTALEPLQKIARDLSNCPTTQEAVEAARASSPSSALSAQPSISLEVYQQDWTPGFAAFLDDGTLRETGKAHLMINIGGLLSCVESGELPPKDFPYMVAETLMHEAIHALEAWAKGEFSEEKIEELCQKYRAKYRPDDEAHWQYDPEASRDKSNKFVAGAESGVPLEETETCHHCGKEITAPAYCYCSEECRQAAEFERNLP